MEENHAEPEKKRDRSVNFFLRALITREKSKIKKPVTSSPPFPKDSIGKVIGEGSESVVRSLGDKHVLKEPNLRALGTDFVNTEEYLRLQQQDHKILKRIYGDYLLDTMFTRGHAQDGTPTNYIVQEKKTMDNRLDKFDIAVTENPYDTTTLSDLAATYGVATNKLDINKLNLNEEKRAQLQKQAEEMRRQMLEITGVTRKLFLEQGTTIDLHLGNIIYDEIKHRITLIDPGPVLVIKGILEHDPRYNLLMETAKQKAKEEKTTPEELVKHVLRYFEKKVTEIDKVVLPTLGIITDEQKRELDKSLGIDTDKYDQKKKDLHQKVESWTLDSTD